MATEKLIQTGFREPILLPNFVRITDRLMGGSEALIHTPHGRSPGSTLDPDGVM